MTPSKTAALGSRGLFIAAALTTLVLAATPASAGASHEPGNTRQRVATNSGPRITGVELQSGAKKVVSSTHRKLRVRLDAFRSIDGSSPNTVSATLETRNASESHTWTFRIRPRALKFQTTAKGQLHLKAAASAPYATINLSFTPVGKSHLTKCNGVPLSSTRNVRLSGRLSITSHSHGPDRWGAVGGLTSTFRFGSAARITFDYDVSGTACGGGPPNPCSFGRFWQADHGTVSMSGEATSNKSRGTLLGQRTAKLHKPAGAVRVDSVTARTEPESLISEGANVALPIVAASHPASGRAEITSTMPVTSAPTGCGKSTLENVDLWVGTYFNSTPKLRLATEIFTPITLPNGAHAEIVETQKAS
jgi:hypothetical protein